MGDLGRPSSEAADLVRRGHEAFTRGDVARVVELTVPDADWGTSGRFPGIDVRYHGHEGVTRWMRDLRDAWERFEVGLEEVVEEGDGWIAVVEHLRGRGRGSGVDVDTRIFALYALRGGLLWRRDAYASREDLVEALPGGPSRG